MKRQISHKIDEINQLYKDAESSTAIEAYKEMLKEIASGNISMPENGAYRAAIKKAINTQIKKRQMNLHDEKASLNEAKARGK